MDNPSQRQLIRKPLHWLTASLAFILIFITTPSDVYAVEYCSVPCPDGFADCEAPCPKGSSKSSSQHNNANIQEKRRRQEMEARRKAEERSRLRQQEHDRAAFEKTKKQAMSGLKGIDDNSYNTSPTGGMSTNELGLKRIDEPAGNKVSSGDNLWKIKQILQGGYKPPPRLLPNSGRENAVATSNEKIDNQEQKILKINNLYSKLTASGKNKINSLINDILASRSSAASKVKQHDEKLIEIVMGLLEKVRDHGLDSRQVQDAIREIEQKILQNADETLGGG